MIHSMSGGVIREAKIYDFAKVEIEDEGVFWYILENVRLKEGDFVVVPFGIDNKLVKGKILRIDKNVSAQNAPFPIKRIKRISN